MQTRARNPKPSVHSVRPCKASGSLNSFETRGSGFCSAVAVSRQTDDVFACHRAVQLGTPGSQRDKAVVWGGVGVLPTNREPEYLT